MTSPWRLLQFKEFGQFPCGTAAMAGKAVATVKAAIAVQVSHTFRIVFPPFDSSYVTGWTPFIQPTDFTITIIILVHTVCSPSVALSRY
ncbi:MAG: hypothetical protein ACM3X9_04975 [Bacillota bacterium]